MSNIFGSNAQNNAPNATGGLFGSNTNTSANQATGGSLFGSNTAQNTGGGLFGSTTNNNTSGGGGMFGSNNAPNSGGGGIFGGGGTQSTGTGTGGGLFGATTSQSAPGGGLFGTTSTQPSTGGGLLGNQNAANTSSLFGNVGSQNTSSLFGGGNNAPQNATGFGANPQPATGSSLFGSNPQNAQSSLFGGSSAVPAPQQQQMGSSLFGPTVNVGQGGHQLSQIQLDRLRGSGYSILPNEKSIPDQVGTVSAKWDPDNKNNILKAYLYNAVSKAYAPFYYPDPNQGEDEKSWEEALSRKPEFPKIPNEDPNMTFVPALCRGFKQLGERVEVQIRSVNDMRSRLHEMSTALDAVMDRHQQNITVRLANTKKQHQDLSQRCLRLAVKVQILRNRGYALDGAEEGLRKTLASLESQVMDSGFAGREDEIWARMVALRERARWLEDEGRRVAAQSDGQSSAGATSEGISEDIIAKTRKILKDYDDQLSYLNKELEDVKKEYGEWEATQR